MPARRTTARGKRTAPAAEPACPVCRGSGWETESVCVGRSQRRVGTSEVICPRCLGSGIDPTPDRY
ncbi:hypothetical protein [Streptomyces barkulensis]|uniref:hypothetical protein n=1 Tax=Streptomyces barkulensis TaxID=1257026 RepID=UPI000C6D9F5E|nr:hypothetical protein [Streptomyces barkulensis]